MQRQFEGKRHEMMDRENALRVKQSELENSIIRTKQREVCWIETFLNVFFEMTLLSNARDGLRWTVQKFRFNNGQENFKFLTV